MKRIKVENLQEWLKGQPFNFIRFLDSEKKVLVPRNSKIRDLKKTIELFFLKMNSELCADGIYYLAYRDTVQGEDKFIQVVKGEEPVLQPKVEVVKNVQLNDDDMKETVSLREYYDLKLELTQANIRLKELETIINEMDNEGLDDDDDNDGNIINKIIEVGTPLLDKYFELQQEKNVLLSERIQIRKNQLAINKPVQQPVQRPVQQNTVTPSPTIQPVVSPGNTFSVEPGQEQNEQQQYIAYISQCTTEQLQQIIDEAYEEGGQETGDQVFEFIKSIRIDL